MIPTTMRMIPNRDENRQLIEDESENEKDDAEDDHRCLRGRALSRSLTLSPTGRRVIGRLTLREPFLSAARGRRGLFGLRGVTVRGASAAERLRAGSGTPDYHAPAHGRASATQGLSSGEASAPRSEAMSPLGAATTRGYLREGGRHLREGGGSHPATRA